MIDTPQSALTHEWVTLQNNHERYEHSALLIKLAAIAVFAFGTLCPHGGTLRASVFLGLLCCVLGVLWAQEAILRTSQARLGARLLRIEALARAADNASPQTHTTHALQLHSEWLASRPGGMGLLGEYARNALRPTVAFPYGVLAALLVLLAFCH